MQNVILDVILDTVGNAAFAVPDAPDLAHLHPRHARR